MQPGEFYLRNVPKGVVLAPAKKARKALYNKY